MSKLSADATPFVPVFQLLQQINALTAKLQNQIKIVDMFLPPTTQKIKFTSSTDMFLSSVHNKSSCTVSESSFSTHRAYKRYLCSKTWRDRQCKIVHPLPTSRSSQTSSSTFIKYLHDYKKGKFKSVNDTLISTSKEGGVISALSPSDVPSSIILNSSSTLPCHGNSDTSDISVKSGVIVTYSSPRVLYLPRNPPIPRLSSVSITSSSIPSIVLDTVSIPAWPSHSSKVFKLYNSSSFNEKGCIIPLLETGEKFRVEDTSLTLSEYFHYSLSSCTINFCSHYLKCCFMCGLTSHSDKRTFCIDSCSDCPSPDHAFHSCPKFLSWLHNSKTRYHSKWLRLVTKWISAHPPSDFKN